MYEKYDKGIINNIKILLENPEVDLEIRIINSNNLNLYFNGTVLYVYTNVYKYLFHLVNNHDLSDIPINECKIRADYLCNMGLAPQTYTCDLNVEDTRSVLESIQVAFNIRR